MTPEDVESITKAEINACTDLQIYWFARHQNAALALDAFQSMENLNLSNEDLDEPAVDEIVRLLAPLAPTLKLLNMNNNNLGGTITNDFGVFKVLERLALEQTGLRGPPLPVTQMLAALAPTLKG